MKINSEIKLDIQTFIYFLFKGTLSSKLIKQEFDYIHYLLQSPRKLFSILKFFAENYEEKSYVEIQDIISDMIILDYKNLMNLEILHFDNNLQVSDFWKEFINLSYAFCFNKFQEKIENFNLQDFEGCGTDALPYFAVWTNVVEISEKNIVLNPKVALKRANERLLSNVKFQDWEIEQELY